MDGPDAIDYILNNNIEGDIVECGCGNGNFEVMWIRRLLELNSRKHIHMFDTFAGLTEPSDKDFSLPESTQYTMSAAEVKNEWKNKIQSKDENGWCKWSVDYVKNVLAPFHYPEEYLHYIVGDIRKTLLDEKNIPDKIAILRLDTDWYDSSKIELIKLFTKVVPGGLVVFDDYNHWNGQRQATDEYFEEIGEKYEMIKVNDKTVAMIKRNPNIESLAVQDLFQKYGNRDTQHGTDKGVSHSYVDTYSRLFTPRKDTVKTMLEIGISGGFGLLCYAKYFRNATIYGVDIEDNIHANIKQHHRIKLFFQNAHDKSLLESLPAFDIIIEDGSHELQDQFLHFMECHSLVKPDGLYIIEDIPIQNMVSLSNLLFSFAESKGFEVSTYDGGEKTNRGDDIMMIFHKKT